MEDHEKDTGETQIEHHPSDNREQDDVAPEVIGVYHRLSEWSNAIADIF